MENIHKSLHRSLHSASYSVPCELCSIGCLCIPMLIDKTLNSVLNRKQSFEKDEILIHQGGPLDKLYVIHAGALKTYVTTGGNEQINGFYLPGDIIGLDGVHTKKYHTTVKALTNTQVCELKYHELMDLVSENITIRDMVFNLMSTDICNYQKLVLCFSQKKAEERLAYFIYSIYSRYSLRGHVSLNIKLSMSRTDIANYLGLTIETVSRILTHLQNSDVLSVKGKYIQIKNLNELIKLSGENN